MSTESADEGAFAYDEVPYPPLIHRKLTPDHLYGAALVSGFEGAEPTTARMLDIGCGDGITLIGVAAVYPNTKCVGFDLSAVAIARGQKLAREAGITNVELLEGDILTFPRDGEKFDYIVAHGIYCWVPEDVREALLELIAARLAPGGIAYVGYDSLPGCASKLAIADFVKARVNGIADPEKRIDAAIELFNVLARNQDPVSRLRTQLDQLVLNLPTYRRGYMFHDWLAPHYLPISIPQLQERLGKAGLYSFGDVDLTDLKLDDLDEAGQAIVEATDSFAERAAARAMLKGDRMYRADLIARSDAPPARIEHGMARLWFSFTGRRTDPEVPDGPPRYAMSGENAFTIVRPELPPILDALEARGDEMSFEELREATGLATDVLEEALLRLASYGVVSIYSTPRPYTTQPGERPRAGRLVSTMMDFGTRAVTLRNREFSVDAQPTRMLLALCNGQRTRDELAGLLGRSFGAEIPRERIDAAIDRLADYALFEA